MTPLEAALSYIDRGWAVFPCWGVLDGRCACGEPCPSPGKHPLGTVVPQGLRQATRDEAKAAEWWGKHPTANVAVATGEVSGLLVLDCDPPDGGRTIVALMERFGPLPDTLTARTGRDGRHLVFQDPGNVRSRNGFADGLDIKAAGGYIVAPPSLHVSGNRYEWLLEEEPAVLPLRWVDALAAAQPATIQRAISSPIREGQRNQTLASMAGAMRRRGMEPEAILAALEIENRRCVPPLPTREVRAIADSIGRYQPADAPESKSPPRAKRLDLVAIHSSPAPETPWIIRGWLAEQDRVFLLGKPKTGKSVLLTDLAIALATGRPWVGLSPRAPQRILYVDEEQTEILAKQRFKAAMDGREITGSLLDLLNENLAYLHRNRLNLDHGPAAELLFEEIRQHKPNLVLIDSLKRIHGREENENSAMSLFFGDVLDPLLRDSQIGLVALHHPRKGQVTEETILECLRGAGAIADYADSVWGYLPDGQDRKLVCAASRWDGTGRPIKVRMDTSNGRRLDGQDAGNQDENWILDLLRQASSTGARRKEIESEYQHEHDTTAEVAERQVSRLLGFMFQAGLVAKANEGREKRYWLRQFAPPEAATHRQ